jgi:hypothetical protein
MWVTAGWSFPPDWNWNAHTTIRTETITGNVEYGGAINRIRCTIERRRRRRRRWVSRLGACKLSKAKGGRGGGLKGLCVYVFVKESVFVSDSD